ncbi:uncharacterized protein LOC117573300 [Drosophila albomicans]|uniref:Uncharacterized protein LOC117573300 n=1 Tax=Drosophila albomicans TaxID=7291 RepID=A0A6P8XLN5_DROAB|nr:uncharacterized protein LOC117573300 [Drosophila albomicans]
MLHIEMRRPQQHNSNSINGLFTVIIVVIVVLTTGTTGFLLYPASTILQLTSSMSVPIDIPDARKVFMDLGFQMNYNMPYDVASFYNPTIWSNALERRRRHTDGFTGTVKELMEAENGIHPNDFTAGELYTGLERRLEENGFHKSCLLRSVCEIALHPLADDHSYSFTLIVKIITFLLTPSQHEGFGPNEKLYQHRYERAEKIGFMGGDCQKAYPKCELDVLTIFSKIVR